MNVFNTNDDIFQTISQIHENNEQTLKYLKGVNFNLNLGFETKPPLKINDIINDKQNDKPKQKDEPKQKEVPKKEDKPEQKDVSKKEEIPKDINAVIVDKKKVVFTDTTTTNSSEISKNIMTHIFSVYKDNKDNEFIEKYLKSDEKGGLDSLIYCISNLFKLMRIFNQDFFMRLLTILSEKDKFNEMFELINKNFTDKDQRKQFFIDSVFIKFDDELYNNTIKTIYKGKDKELEQKMNRDYLIYKTYYPNTTNKKIMLMNQFLYDFIQLNNGTNLNILLVNTTRGNDMAIILMDLINNVLKLKDIYGSYKDKIDIINDYYKQIVDKHSRIFSYVKYRQDTNTVNPRYSVYYDENKYLHLRYCNIDGRIGFTNENDDTSYDYDSAVEFINLNVSKNEYYTFGPFHGIYSNELKYNTNDKIAEEFSENILKKLITEKQNVCILPIGQSGSGKTSSVIYFSVYNPKTKTMTKMDGVMVEVCNLDKFTDHFDRIQMNMKNIYLKHGPNDYKVVELGITYKKEGAEENEEDNQPTFIFKDGHWVFEKDNNIWMSESINNAFENRQVEPTPNNENSSRSHVIVCLKLFVKGRSDFVNFIVCDLAGAENKFQIDSLREIKKFDERYKISNKYKEGKELIKFDNYFRTDNENSAKYIENDEYKKYNDSKTNLQNQYKKYIDLIKTTSKNDGAFVDFDDDEFLKKNELEKCNNSLNNFKSDDYKQNTNEYIQTLQEKIDELYEETKMAKKKSELYDIINSKKTIGKINGYKKTDDVPADNFKYIKEFPDFFDVGINFSEKNYTISNSIPNEIFYGAKLKRNLEEGKTTTFEYYVKNNSLTNYFDLVIYLKSVDENNKIIDKKNKKQPILNNSVEFSVYENFDKTTINKYKIFNQFETKVPKYITETLKDNYNSKKKEYLSTICQLGRLLKIYYNGMLRVNEGKMINKSLQDLKNGVKSLVLKSFIDPKTNTLPFIFDKEVFPYCRNLYSDENIYEKFYNTPDKDNTKSGQIIKVIKDFGVDVSKLNFAVFTVINLSDYFPEKKKVTNNPPNPPYININNLIYLRNIQKIFPNFDKLKSEINNIIDKVFEYDFYKNLDDMTKLKDQYKESNPKLLNEIEGFADSLIKLIQPNNSATLIGTLADAVSIQTITLADQFPCAQNKKLFKERTDFASEFNSSSTEEELWKFNEAKPLSKKDEPPAPPAPPAKQPAKKTPKTRRDGKKKKSIKINIKRQYKKY